MTQTWKGVGSIGFRILKAKTVQSVLVCSIHNYVRPTRLMLRAWREKEHAKFPERAKPPQRSSFVDWNYQAEIFAFGKRLNENFEGVLLKQALVDASYIIKERRRLEELGMDAENLDIKDNRELSESGSRLLTSTLTAFVKKEFPKMPSEGVESVVDRLTSNAVLATISSHIGTKDLIQCYEYPPSEETFAKAFQAVVGALDKSSGGGRTERFITDFVATQLCGKDIMEFWDIPQPWVMLMDINRQMGGSVLEPRILREAGRNTLLSAFIVGIYDQNKKLVGTGIGETVDIAQEMAARDILRGIFGMKDPRPPFEFQSTNFPMKLIPHVRNP